MNNEDQIPDAEIPSTALVKAEPRAAQEPTVTAAQARVEAVAETLKAAYVAASTLKLTPEEASALSEDFPDDAFSLGAGGDPNLIYISHAHLRQRLNKVLGIGAAVPIRRREWAEEFKYWKDGANKTGVRVYVDMVLLVRGCVVGEAIGDAVYYPDNAKTNYSDALESAKSAAFRRCAKEFGVGLQAWMKEWVVGWKSRQKGLGRTPEAREVKSPTEVRVGAPTPRAAAKTSDLVPQGPTEEQWKRFIGELSKIRPISTAFWQENGAIAKPNGVLEELPMKYTPATMKEFDQIMAEIEAFGTRDQGPDPEEWRNFVVPFGKHEGKKLADLETKSIWGFWKNFTVEKEYNGNPKKPETIARDQAFRDALDDAGVHYDFGSDERDEAPAF